MGGWVDGGGDISSENIYSLENRFCWMMLCLIRIGLM